MLVIKLETNQNEKYGDNCDDSEENSGIGQRVPGNRAGVCALLVKWRVHLSSSKF